MSIQLIQQYHAKVEKIIRYGGSRNESALRKPFQDLLEAYASSKNLLLVPEVEVRVRGGRRVVPDGTLKDALRQDWGYWESKDEKDDLEAEIAAKFAKGYPSTNILFEDTHTAVLYQNGEEVGRSAFTEAAALDALLNRFVAYEPQEVTDFHRAIEQFNEDVPALAEELRRIIDEQVAANAKFKQALSEFLELAQQAINPRVELADAREMIIQHILTEDIFMTVFDEPQFHRENAIARKLQEVVSTFYHGATQRSIHGRIAPYYETINARAAQIVNHHEKQKFLKALYETFYRAYNPKAADRLGIVYTPEEIVRFQLHAVDHLLFKHFGKTLGEAGVEFLDPATGTGTYVTELIEHLPHAQLPYKYREEIHCNEVAILPYYIANLNIEYTYKQRTGEYVPFENICFVDTLDNQGFEKSGQHQMDFLGLVDENTERIQRQNTRKISVIMGNPPYNANQLNENENNKNREYPEIDRRVKDTYIKHSTAQKTKMYDMYARFLRWASDRLDPNGVIAFVSNNSFLDARGYDGFRKVVAEEFNHIYVIDLKGDAHTSGERRKQEGGNVFNDQIQVGVAVYFLVRKEGEQGCHIHYNAVPDHVRGEEKKAYLRDNDLKDLQFVAIQADARNNWLNQTTTAWDTLIPIASKESKFGKGQTSQQSIFKTFSLGVATNRDEWVYGHTADEVEVKVKHLIKVYNQDAERLKGIELADVKDEVDYSIKWTRAVKKDLAAGKKYTYRRTHIIDGLYRPYSKQKMYFSRDLNETQYLMPRFFSGDNLAILFSGPNSPKSFTCLVTTNVPDLNSLSAAADGCRVMPFYDYTTESERVDNITDWAVEQFRARYGRRGEARFAAQDTQLTGNAATDRKSINRKSLANASPLQRAITKQDIFHYVYAVLHHPAYREKYALNLKREFPRIPFYDDFWQWAAWGKQLMDLHLNYEQVKPFKLKREDRRGEALAQDTQSIGSATTTGKSIRRTSNASASPLQIKPRLVARKDTGIIEIDSITTLRGVPPEAWDYRLGTYSAIEWVLERYKERMPKDPTIREKFNTYRFADYKEYVIDLLGRVCAVSVETMKIIAQMPK
jgi:predicted helicase